MVACIACLHAILSASKPCLLYLSCVYEDIGSMTSVMVYLVTPYCHWSCNISFSITESLGVRLPIHQEINTSRNQAFHSCLIHIEGPVILFIFLQSSNCKREMKRYSIDGYFIHFLAKLKLQEKKWRDIVLMVISFIFLQSSNCKREMKRYSIDGYFIHFLAKLKLQERNEEI